MDDIFVSFGISSDSVEVYLKVKVVSGKDREVISNSGCANKEGANMTAGSDTREPMKEGIDEELVKGTGSNPTLSSTLSDTKRWGDIGSPFG